MNKNIVVLTGSPRKNGNSFAMTEAFIKACEGKGYTVSRFNTAFMEIKGCTACDSCYTAGGACIYDDDFNEVATAIEDADAVIFTCPVYWYGMPAPLKAALDKFYAFSVGNKIEMLKHKKTALMTCWEEDGDDVGDGVKFTYRKSIKFMGWDSIGEVAISGVNSPADINKTDGIAQSIKLANHI